MTGAVCLQGGGEFSPGCRPMDADLVLRSPGRVVVSALAGTVGRDYATATANGVRHFEALGAVDVVGAPDAREDPAGAARALRGARLVVLPGGSPSRLLGALRDTGLDAVLAGLLDDGVLLMGSSAGAMVVCPWTVLPEGGPAAARGLALVQDVLVLPHWSDAAGRDDWLRVVDGAVPAGTLVLGIPEESGVVVLDGSLTAVGRSATTVVGTGARLAPGRTYPVAHLQEAAS